MEARITKLNGFFDVAIEDFSGHGSSSIRPQTSIPVLQGRRTVSGRAFRGSGDPRATEQWLRLAATLWRNATRGTMRSFP